MKKLLYYSPFIPIIGFIIHLFWIVFYYEIYSIEEDAPKCFVPMILQVLYFGFLVCFYFG
jgi:hypothetical protein